MENKMKIATQLMGDKKHDTSLLYQENIFKYI